MSMVSACQTVVNFVLNIAFLQFRIRNCRNIFKLQFVRAK